MTDTSARPNGAPNMLVLERDLIPPSWRNASEYNRTMFVFCPSSFMKTPIADVVLPINRACSKLSGHPVAAHFVGFEQGPKFAEMRSFISYQEGERRWNNKIENVQLPPGEYCVIVSPFYAGERGEQLEHDARMAICMCRGFITSLYGTSIAERPVAELHIHQTDGKISTVSDVIENYIEPAEYACLSAGDIGILADRIDNFFPEEQRVRFETAFRFIERTAFPADRNVRFSNAWTALEVACGSRGKAEAQVSELCGTDRPDLFRKLKTARDDLLHSGKDFEMSADEERTLRAAVLAALLGRFNLESRVSL